MELFRIALCLCAMAPCILSGGAPLWYQDYDNEEIIVSAGAKSFELVWEGDQDANQDYTIYEFVHEHPVTTTQRLIGNVNDMTPSEVATGYSLNVTKPEHVVIFTLTIDTVERQDDGAFIGIAISNRDSTARTMVVKNVTVVKKLAELHLQFHEREPISSKPEDSVEVEAGSYPVKCIAEGSNPATDDVTLHLDGNAVTLEGEAKMEMMEGDIRQFKTTVMGNVELEGRTAVYEVECVATDKSGDTLSTKLDLKVMVQEKEDVKCEETKAKEGDMAVSLVCTLDTSLNITSLAFEVGKTGEVFEVGGEMTNSNFTVTSMRSVSGKATVSLTLAKAEDWHFDSDFYLVITATDGSTRKEPLTLTKSDSDGGNGNCLTASLGWILFFAIAVLFIRH